MEGKSLANFTIKDPEEKYRKQLETLLREAGLKKTLFKSKFKSKEVIVKYNIEIKGYPDLSIPKAPYLIIDLFSKNMESARSVYNKLDEWTEGLRDKTIVRNDPKLFSNY